MPYEFFFKFEVPELELFELQLSFNLYNKIANNTKCSLLFIILRKLLLYLKLVKNNIFNLQYYFYYFYYFCYSYYNY